MSRARSLGLLVGVAVCMVLGACVERQARLDDDEPILEPACMTLPARGYWNDGSTNVIVEEDGSVGSVCMCMTEDELIDQVYLDELNERGLAECNRMAELHGNDFDWTTCQESYEQGDWLGLVHFARSDQTWLDDEDLTCDGEDELGCAVSGQSGRPAGWGALLAALWLAGRRRSRLSARRSS